MTLETRINIDRLGHGCAFARAAAMARSGHMLILGAAWIMRLTTLNGATQAILPNWVRGRGLAVYLTVFNGAMTAGNLGWGAGGKQLACRAHC